MPSSPAALPVVGVVWEMAIVAAGFSAVADCAQGGVGDKASPLSAPSPTGTGSLSQGVIGVSHAGVTTRVDVPADSTEEEYYQACHAAKVWMEAQPRTGELLIEPYLAMVQASPSGVAGSWNIR